MLRDRKPRINLPEWVRIPRLIVISDEAFVDEPGPYNPGNCDDEAKTEQQIHQYSLPAWHLQLGTISARMARMVHDLHLSRAELV